MTERGGGDRRVGDVLVALTLVLVLVFVAVAISATGGTLATTVSNTIDSGSGEGPVVDRSVLVGGGSHGDAEYNPLGAPSGNESNPFQTRSDEIQFYVETEHPGYWRVDAYNNYTEGAWERTGDHTAYRGRISPKGPTTAAVNHTVTLERDAATLPTVWQPASVTVPEEQHVMVSPETGVRAVDPMEAGTRYTVESYCYAPDAEQLRETDGTPPVAIEDRYTGVPGTVPDRVHSLGADVTADANSSIEAATAISKWLETNTAYDVEAEYDGSDGDPVDQFLFEGQAGSAEHMAASMTLLLRTQGIPARYVTGYAPGESLAHAGDTYAVRSIHAHAWTEVYISGHGWIPVDPTPASDRIAVENAFIDTDGEMIDVPITGECPMPVATDSDEDSSTDGDDQTQTGTENESDGETTEQPANETTDETGSSESSGEDTTQELNIELSEAVPGPGTQLIVTVTSDGTLVEGGVVSFNDDQVGTTNETGQVSGTVPYSETLTVTVTDANAETRVEIETISVSTAADISVNTEPTPLITGGDATVHARLNENPLPGADVYLDGAQLGTTSEDGVANLTIPDDQTSDTVTLSVRRGELETQYAAPVGTLEVTPTTDRFLALPGQTVPVSVTAAGMPVEGAVISQGDERVGTTDENGTAHVSMGGMPTTTVTASFVGQQATEEIENLFLPAALLGLTTLGFVSGALLLLHKRRDTAERVASSATQRGHQLFNWIATQLLWVETLPSAVRDRSNGSWRASVVAIIQSPVAVLAWISTVRPRRLITGVNALSAGLYQAIRAALTGARRSSHRSPGNAGQSEEQQLGSTATYQSVRDVWRAFVRLVARHVDSTATPTAIATLAIEKGFPKRPVKQLTDAFRAAEYGPSTLNSQLETATDALGTIENDTAEQHGHTTEDRGAPPGDGPRSDERPGGD
jgi:transglutaminase-like putative cysteine protease